MADDNKVKLELDLELGDSAVRTAKKQLDDLAKSYEDSFRKRQQTLGKSGRFSTGFMLADEEYKKSVKNVSAAKDHYLKTLQEYENKSRPVTKRVAGWFHKVLYGEKVQSHDEAEAEQRKLDRRMTGFQQKLHGTLALSTALSQTLAPVPGGGVLHAGLAGMAGGYAEGTIDPETGERRKGLRGLVGGLLGGLKGLGVAAGLTLLAKGVGGAMQGSQESENVLRMLTHAGGGVGLGRAGAGLAFGARGLQAPEAAGVIGQVFRGGGGTEAARAALRAQVGLGLGGQYAQMLGGLADVGVRGGQQAIDANAKKLWVDIIAAGYDKALGRIDPRKVAAGISGAIQMMGRQTLGTTLGDPSQIFRMQRFLGQSGAFTGQRGFEMMGRLEGFVKGESSPLARAVSLMQSGLGKGGVGMVEAMRRSEQGLFGEKGPGGVKKVQDFVQRFSKMGGGNRDLTSLLMSQSGGMSVSAASELFDLVKSGKFTEKEFEEAKKKAMPLEERAYEAMASMNWTTINKLLEDISRSLGNLFTDIGGFKGVIEVLKETRDAVRAIRDFVLGVKTAAAEEGVGGAAMGLLTGKTAERNRQRDEFNKKMAEVAGEGWSTVKQSRMGVPDQKAIEAVYAKLGMSGVKQNERFYEVETKDRKRIIVIELRDPKGNLLALEELEGSAKRQSQTPQARVSQ